MAHNDKIPETSRNSFPFYFVTQFNYAYPGAKIIIKKNKIRLHPGDFTWVIRDKQGLLFSLLLCFLFFSLVQTNPMPRIKLKLIAKAIAKLRGNNSDSWNLTFVLVIGRETLGNVFHG